MSHSLGEGVARTVVFRFRVIDLLPRIGALLQGTSGLSSGTAIYRAVQREIIPPDPILPLLTAYVVANLAVLVLYGADKRRARMRLRRISERTLLFSALAGPFGALAGMSLFHHKTRKLRFVVAIPLFIALHAAVIIAVFGAGTIS